MAQTTDVRKKPLPVLLGSSPQEKLGNTQLWTLKVALLSISNQEEFSKVDDVSKQSVEGTLPKKATARAITLNFITGGLGSAMFSLPWSIAGTSIISGIVIVAVVMLLNAWTISIIVRAADRYEVFDLGAVIEHIPHVGRPLMLLTNACIWFVMFMCLVSYTMVMHDSAYKFVQGTIIDSRLVLMCLASLLVLPLCFFSQRLLEKTSSIAIIINVYLFILIGIFYGEKAADDELPEGSCIFGGTVRGNFAMASVMFQAVIIQMCVLPMYEELENRTPEKFDKIVAVGFSVLFVIFCGFSSIAYLLFGPNVNDDVLYILPDNIWSSIAQIGVILVVSCVYPIMLYPMIAPLKTMAVFQGATQVLALTVAKLLIVGAALLVALLVTSLGVVNIINGAGSAAIFVTLIPVAIGFFLLDVGPCYRVALLFLLVVGIGLSACGLIFEGNFVADLICYIKA